MKTLPPALRVLLIKDNPVDVDILKHGMSKLGLSLNIMVYDRGETACDFLRSGGESAQVDLVILDLKLKGEYGLDTLKKIRALPATKDVPVIIWTSSDHDGDMVQSYRLGGTFFMSKPGSENEFRDVIGHLKITGRLKQK